MAELSKDAEQKIKQLQLLEQNIQNFSMQRQSFQSQALEIENALDQLEKTKGATYKIVNSIMISVPKEDLKKELQSKKEVVDLRIKSVEKQENKLKEQASEIQAEVMKHLQK